ncbi:Vegetative incompatibility protein HET-E-1 [Ceratocystis fimbriata CBS 114723]|uniref:Vegetative incompatibility protein HET-E-1 n=1 Tax=Ceratocystis fimbriata CBS 114723 TaxID=1035309 RepID=A0A2C5WV72_9PEZI|nr:Vegetative incompatibility protein HET-E-1 [Ceratocystis fimbriata CBS 114723]
MDASMGQTTGPPVRILSIGALLDLPKTSVIMSLISIDGGGVRGLSSLLILEKIMERMKQLERLPEVPRPCDRFDLIGGTGTGGIIAIMLGRLRMTVDESIKAYKKLSETGFCEKPTKFKRRKYAFSGKKLEAAIKVAIRDNCRELSCVEQRRDQNTSTADTCTHDDAYFYKESCVKTAVLATTKKNVDTLPTIFKTYSEDTESLATCRVWEVARATSAAAAFFKPIKLGRDGIEFIDSAFSNNNPCETLIKEAKKLFPRHETIALSLGTGLGGVVEIDNLRSSITSAFEKMASSSKGTHQHLKDIYGITKSYHRFEVTSRLMDVTLLDSSSFSKITALTEIYVKDNDDLVTNCVKALATNEGQHNDMDENDKQCLSDLCVADPCTDKKTIESTKGGLLKDSYKWILSHNSFQQFRNKSESQILWIKGDPGKGKTMLLCGIIDELTVENSSTLSYFFCQATSNRHNTATSVLRGLIYHLAHCNPRLIKHVRDKYDYKRELFKNETSWHDLCDILTAMVNDPILKNVILIVDGLHECSIDRLNLLKFIAEPSQAKWIVSSRNWLDIQDVLDDAEQKVKIHLEINQASVSAAVDSFIEFKVDQLRRTKKFDQAKKAGILEYLRTNSNGTFLWVALVCHELSNPKVRNWHILDTMKSFPPGLDLLYQRMMMNISESKDAQLCKDIVAYVLIVYRPLTLDELRVLAEGLEDKRIMEVKEIIASCGSFLTIHNNYVSFVHQSAKDYFHNKALQEILPFGIQHQHHKVLLRSLDILQKKLQRDIYGLQAPGCLIDEVSVPEPNPLAPIQCFCIFWADHLCEAAADDGVDVNDGILAFFNEKYLQWLEALSLLRSISSAGRTMENLAPFLQKKASQDLQRIVKDAQRFLLSYGGVIEIAPLQVYVSALIFSPANSLIRQIYSHEEPDWIEPKPRVEENWDACLRTLEGHSDGVNSVVFSNNVQRLASGSSDYTFKIWDATSGVCLQTLEGHNDSVTSVAFSNDGQRLASGSRDKTVKIWDATSGACLQTLEGHNDSVTSVVFSNDGQRLASGSWDRTVKIWDATSGVCLQTLEGHNDSVTSVVFSNDGQRLASGSRDSTVKIWDATSGACLETLEGHNDGVTSVMFSNVGQRLASGSYDKTVKIWDATTGACLHTLEGHDEHVTSVEFLKDGKRLASGSKDKTVIWDATTGKCVQSFKNHTLQPKSILFSSDGQRLASPSLNATLKIWDANSGISLYTLGGHEEQVTTATFSTDASRLASGSLDKTVKIWDLTTQSPLRTSEKLDEQVISMVFSNDGQWFASMSKHNTIKIRDMTSDTCRHTLNVNGEYTASMALSNDGQRLALTRHTKLEIWDATSGKPLHTLEGHNDHVTALVFSNDGQRVATGCRDTRVRIWEADSGKCLRTLEGHDSWVTSVVFSNDGRRLASECQDKTFKIWDLSSGLHFQSPWLSKLLFSIDPFNQRSPTFNFGGLNLDIFSATEISSTNQTSLPTPAFTIDNLWIMKDGKRIVWLPPGYRPATLERSQSVLVHGTKLAVISTSSRGFIIGFKSTGWNRKN